MATADHVQAEVRERPRVAVVAAVAALFTLLEPIIGMLVTSGGPRNLLAATLFARDHQLELALAAVCSVIGLLATAYVLDFLLRATRHRNPGLSPQLRLLPWAGAVGLAVATVALQVRLSLQLDAFATDSTFTFDEALAIRDPSVFTYVGIVAQLAFALSLVLVSVHAMRVGLVTRFVGYLGMIAALFVLVPALLRLPIVQVFWLGALALIFAGRGRVPPAWASGEAEPWPSAQEVREQRVRAAEARRRARAGEPPESSDTDAVAGTNGTADPARVPAPRKRKKRR